MTRAFGAWTGHPARRDTAFASGAHIISTDYPAGEPHAETGYLVEFADSAAARVNPISGPASLRGQPVTEWLPSTARNA